MSRETLNILKQNLSYHFKNVDGTYNIPRELPFLKETFKEIDKLIQEHEDLLKLVESKPATVVDPLNEYHSLDWFTERIGDYVWSSTRSIAYHIENGRDASDLWTSQRRTEQKYCDFKCVNHVWNVSPIQTPQWFDERIGTRIWSIKGSHSSSIIGKGDVCDLIRWQYEGARFRDIEPTDNDLSNEYFKPNPNQTQL